jgi:hypothetical protein
MCLLLMGPEEAVPLPRIYCSDFFLFHHPRDELAYLNLLGTKRLIVVVVS